jgi:hypothetical protein
MQFHLLCFADPDGACCHGCTMGGFNIRAGNTITKSCQDAPLLAVGRNGILVRGFGGQIPPT